MGNIHYIVVFAVVGRLAVLVGFIYFWSTLVVVIHFMGVFKHFLHLANWLFLD